jgi:tungstate transport system substrate-binding protein
MRKILSIILALTLVLGSVGFAFADTAYIVKSGDTLAKIAAKNGTTVQALGTYNKISNANLIYINQKIMIPSKTAATTVSNTANQKAYLDKLMASGTTGQKAWAQAELTKMGTTTPPTVTPPVIDAAGLPDKGSTMVLASTTSTQDTGLFDVLIPAFDKKYGITTKVIAVGSGEAIAMGQRGDADVLLVHSRAAEDLFIKDGWGVNRKDVMYNFYVIVGPKADPAKIKGLTTAAEAFKLIAESDSTFLSRADKSGTNTKELSIWTKAGVTPVAATDKWYLETGKGMGDTLTMANELNGYTITDSGTWGTMKDKLTNLDLLVQGDSALYNPYGVIAVNPAKYDNTNYKAAMAFVNYVTSAEGQKLIKDFKNKGGQYIFIPNAK